VVGRDVAKRIARGLDGVHLHRGELGKDVGHLRELRPVELHVLARRKVSVVAVVALSDVGELAQLARRQQAIGNGNAQHRRIALDVETIPQPQGAELVLGKLAGKEALGLAAELPHALVYQPLIDLVVDVHIKPARASCAAI
jgi:hypothetical protein